MDDDIGEERWYESNVSDDEVEPWDEDDSDATYPCPHCRQPVYEDAERCPHCEQYLSDEDAPAATKPWWIVVGVIVCLGIVYWWTFGWH